MSIVLLDLISDFQPFDDREGSTAWFRTRTPWRAPLAYLNVIFKPANPETLIIVGEHREFPNDLADFLRTQNGAMLFSGEFCFYGVRNPGQLLNRRDPYYALPFDIDSENEYWSLDKDRLIVIGGYSDGSKLCMDRSNSQVYVFAQGGRASIASWPTLEACVWAEIARFKVMFDKTGKELTEDFGPPHHSAN